MNANDQLDKKRIVLFASLIVILIAGVTGGLWWKAHQDDVKNSEVAAQEFSRQARGVSTLAVDRQLIVAASIAPSCGLTTDTGAGSYYVANAPQLKEGDLNYTNLPGDRVAFTGYVYGASDNSQPVKNARVELWQADTDGNFHPNTSGDAQTMNSGSLGLRGYVATDGNGRYEFATIYPGETANRTRHIYIRVSADSYTSVTSQILLAKESDSLQPSKDVAAQALNLACAKPELKTLQGMQQGVFNVHLKAK